MKIDVSNIDREIVTILYNELSHSARSHLAWLHDLNKNLIIESGSLDVYLQKNSHELCILGKWIINNPNLIAHVKNLDSAIQSHEEMHGLAYKLANQKQSSHPISISDYDEFIKAQTSLVMSLNDLRESLSNVSYLYDPLTQVFTRGVMDTLIKAELERSNREKSPCAIAMLDIDHFKGVNDKYGHDAGDVVLTSCAELIKGLLRPYDNVFRYGGEEFLLLFPNTDLEKSEGIANRIRSTIADFLISIGDEGGVSTLQFQLGWPNLLQSSQF